MAPERKSRGFCIEMVTSGNNQSGGIKMKLKEIMTKQVLTVHPEEGVAVAARMMARNNIGSIPVCDAQGKICGMVTDRDLVIRCMAAEGMQGMKVRDVMTGNVITAVPEMDAAMAAHLMGRRQIRRLPVVENGKLCGVVSLGDLAAREESAYDANDALSEISSNVSVRE